MPHFLQLVSTTPLLALALFSCSTIGERHAQTPIPLKASFEVMNTIHAHTVTVQPYPMVGILESVREPLQRVQYALTHFFGRWPEATMEQVVDPVVMEQGPMDYSYVYSNIPVGSVTQEDLFRPPKLMRGKALSGALRFCAKYLCKSGSPLKNHNPYIQTLQWATTTPQVEYVDQVVHKSMLSIVSQNRVGTPASDFVITLVQSAAEGYTFADTTLYALRNKSRVVTFYTSGRDRCTYLLEEVAHDQILQRAYQASKVDILCVSLVYERSEREQGLSALPPFDTPAFNADLRLLEKSLYDLAVAPVMYVISSDGVILRREASFAEVRHYVSTL